MIPIKDGVDNCKENVKVFQQIRCIRIWIWTIWCSIESLDLSVEKIKGFRKREMLTSALRALVNNPVKESFYGKRKKTN